MNYNSAQVGAAEQQAKLPAGTVVASRFQVEGMIGLGGLGPLYRAQDLETQKAVALRLLARDLCQDEALTERLRERVKLASALQHKNIAQVFGMGREGAHRFIAMELVEGRSLRHLVEKKRASHKTFSLKGAYNVIAHVCNALTEAHKSMPHGLVGPGAVLINQVGRIKVCEFGVALALSPGSTAIARLGDRYCIAPEVEQTPTSAGPAADIYSLGIVLFELLTGQPPSGPGVMPSQVLPRLGTSVDQVIARCLHPDPSKRFGEARELKATFYSAMQASEQGDLDESGAIAAASGEVIAVDRPPAAAPVPAPAPQAASPASRPAPQAAPRPVQPRPQQPPPTRQPAPQPTPASRPAPQQTVDIQALLADTSEDQTEKWLIQKDRLDFGPFSLGDLKQQLFKREFTGDDVVVDQETGERGRIRNHPVLRDFIVHLERHFESQRANQAEATRRQQDRRRRAVLIGVVAGSLAILAAGGAITAYYLTREPETRERIVYRERDNLGKLLKGIDITWKKEPEDQAKKRRKLKRRRRRRVAKAKAGHDDDVTRLGDATKEGGDALLSQKVVQGVMASNFGKLKGCVVQAARRDPSLRQVVIDFGVRGSGRVSSVKVNGKRSGPFQTCILARMRAIKFPSFDGQLTRAVFSMNLQY